MKIAAAAIQAGAMANTATRYCRSISALPPKADICGAQGHVRFVPKADMGPLFDHLIGGKQKFRGNGQAKRLGRFEVDDEVILGWLFIR